MSEKSFARKRRRRKGDDHRATGDARGPARAVAAKAAATSSEGLGLPYSAGPAVPLAVVPIQRMPEQEDEPTTQAAPVASPAPAPPPSLGAAASRAIRARGGGTPIPMLTRRTLEARLGADLSTVRVHVDPRAREDARSLRARAFTHRSDIWLGPGESTDDLRLMAHEVTHVLQQTGESGEVVQRAPDDCDSASGAKIVGANIEIPKIDLPDFRKKAQVKQPLKGATERGDQRGTWIKEAAPKIAKSAPGKFTELGAKPVPESGSEFYYFKVGSTGSFLFGNVEQLAQSTAIPYWNESGARESFDVEHMQELQLGGDDDYEGNMELLNSSSNRSSGSKIKNELKKKVGSAVDCIEKHADAPANLSRDPKTLMGNYGLIFNEINAGGLRVRGDGEPHWDRKQIENAEHWKQLEPLSTAEIDKLRENETKLMLFQTPSGGVPVSIDWDKDEGEASFTNSKFLPGFKPSKVTFNVDAGTGTISGLYPSRKRKRRGSIVNPEPKTWGLVGLPGVHYAAYVDQSSILSSLKILKAQGLSAVEIHEAFVDPGRGVVVTGVIKVSLPLLSGTTIDMSIDAGEVLFSKTFSTDAFQIPGPVELTDSNLTIFAGSDGIGVDGNVEFKIQEIAQGHLGAKARIGQGVELDGSLEFDTELFSKAEVDMWYRGDKVGGKGVLEIGPDKVKGIKTARLTIEVDGASWKATGSAETDIPGVDKGEIFANFDPNTGFELGGKLQLTDAIPAISGGVITASVLKQGDTYKVKADGTANLDIPGAKTTITAAYDDGGMLIKATVGYKTKLIDGSITAGASNMPVDAEGNPAGPPADGAPLTAFGKGEVGLTIAPWLQGKVGLELTPTGEVKVFGEVGLPSTLEVFPEKKIEKEIFSIGIDIPIIGVSVLGQRIGVFANISGSLAARASIGPGELRELGIRVEYNPAAEEETRVSGGASFVVPADAGLRLAVSGSLGVGIPIVSARLGLEVGGELGVKGEAKASVQVNWTPGQGVEMNAEGKISAQPVFKFDVTGFALVEADVLLDTIELYSKRWDLASLELGSGLEFGITFPVRYKDGEPFNISLSDVEFTVPDVDTTALLKNLVSQIA